MITQNRIEKQERNMPIIKVLNVEEKPKDMAKYSNYGELWQYNDNNNKFYKHLFCQRDWNFNQLSKDNKVSESINLRTQSLTLNIENSTPKQDQNGLLFPHSIALIQNGDRQIRKYYHFNKDIIKNWYQTMRKYCLLTNFKNHFEFTKIIAQGSSSSVFLVKEKNQKILKLYAAKVIYTNKRFWGEIMDEIKANQVLKHKFIPEYHGAFFGKNKAILIFEYIKGSTLLDYLNIHGKLSEKQAALILENLLKVLEYIHGCGFIHRDIKPSNILVSINGPNLNVKLIDFGLTKKPKDIDLSNICGTPGFIAPEVISRKQYNHKIDIFGLGITLFAMLTGTLPFSLYDSKELLSQNFQYLEILKNSTSVNISPDAQTLIQKMINLHPGLRFNASESLLSNWIVIRGNLQSPSILSIQPESPEKINSKLSVFTFDKSSISSKCEYSTTNNLEPEEGTINQKIIDDYPTFQEKPILVNLVSQFVDDKDCLLEKAQSLPNSFYETDIINSDDNTDSLSSKLDFISSLMPKSKPNQYVSFDQI